MSHKIAFREHGSGPLLILLHGYGGSVMHWDPLVEKLKDQYRVVVPNLSHLYLSKNRLLFPVIIELVSTFLKTNFPGEKARVCGLSFGAAVAWGLALQHPEQVENLILMNPLMPNPVQQFRLPEMKYFFVMPLNQSAVGRLLGTPIGASFMKRASEIFRPHRSEKGRDLSHMTGAKLTFISDIISHFSWLLRSEDWNYWASILSQKKCPTMVMWSEDDQLFDEECYRNFAFDIKADKAVPLCRGGHVISLSIPEMVAPLMLSFLNDESLKKSA